MKMFKEKQQRGGKHREKKMEKAQLKNGKRKEKKGGGLGKEGPVEPGIDLGPRIERRTGGNSEDLQKKLRA